MLKQKKVIDKSIEAFNIVIDEIHKLKNNIPDCDIRLLQIFEVYGPQYADRRVIDKANTIFKHGFEQSLRRLEWCVNKIINDIREEF
jgi:hypothetical protein